MWKTIVMTDEISTDHLSYGKLVQETISWAQVKFENVSGGQELG